MSEAHVAAVATYLPAFEARRGRQAGPDEDAVTMAVEAGRAAIGGGEPVRRVIAVTRDLPLLRGGSAAVLAAGLGLGDEVAVAEQVGGAPAALDAILSAAPGTLVLAVDVETPAGAGAALIADQGASVRSVGRVARSLPLRTLAAGGQASDYDDARLLRERGTRASLAGADLDRPVDVLAGATAKGLESLVEREQPSLPTTGASAPIFALAELIGRERGGTLAGIEEAQLSVVEVGSGDVALSRVERPARPLPKRRLSSASEIKISLPAYDRAFDSKLGLKAGACPQCETLALPPRWRCLNCGHEGRQELVSLRRSGEVHTTTTVHVPVPGLETPYSLAIVAIDDSDVRLLGPVTEAEPGSVSIGDRGELVLRRLAVRSGVPDYGYAFRPDAKGAQA